VLFVGATHRYAHSCFHRAAWLRHMLPRPVLMCGPGDCCVASSVQIYVSDHKLLIQPKSIMVTLSDFAGALQAITPASHRAAVVHARPLAEPLVPLLRVRFPPHLPLCVLFVSVSVFVFMFLLV